MQWYEQLDEKIRDYLPDMTVERDVPMSRHTSFRIGGPAEVMAFPSSLAELQALLRLSAQEGIQSGQIQQYAFVFLLGTVVITVLVILLGLAEECGIRPFLLGRGTNLLVSDRGLDTLVIKTAERMTSIRRLDDVTLEADAGVLLSRLAVYAQQAGLAGLEFAHGIPGTVGGGVYMNAGAYGGEMKDVLTTVQYLTAEGEVKEAAAAELDLRYRHSIFEENGGCILSAQFALTPGKPETIRAKMDELMAKRLDKQPLDKPSAGSTFKRPVGAFAAALIDQCGLRGYRHGGAAVSEKHCGFVVNLGGATCADVLALCEEVRTIVKEKTGYDLEKEIRVVR